NNNLDKNKNRLLTKVDFISAGNGVSIRAYVNLTMTVDGTEITTTCSVANRNHLTYKFLIGKKDLKKFIIDPRK
ncbi:MAG: hypothetical protein ACO3UU_00165, partial [Minisyncoccia bacterium]